MLGPVRLDLSMNFHPQHGKHGQDEDLIEEGEGAEFPDEAVAVWVVLGLVGHSSGRVGLGGGSGSGSGSGGGSGGGGRPPG
mmetsp:Transcript_31176/g.63355  ORF Transcript_31176/g.63355 Transcript_31176/m.63355 type:complete len:81 (-) Transcript_31176:250-492(-)